MDEGGAGGPANRGGHDGLLHRVQGSQGLSIITDDVTGVRVGIPYGLVGTPVTKDYTRPGAWSGRGRNWRAFERRLGLQIDALQYNGRPLQDVISAIEKYNGREITRRTPLPDGVTLEGNDKWDKALFYIEVRSLGSEVRGLSIVHSASARGELAGVIESIKRSFVAFPSNSSAPIADPPPQKRPTPPDRITELEQQLKAVIKRAEDAEARADDARRLADKAKSAEDEAIRKADEKAQELKKERELHEWKLKIIEEAGKKAREEALVLLQKLGRPAYGDRPEPGDKTKPSEPVLPGLPSGKRVALVIGINAYAPLTPLKTALNDVRSIGATLTALGFTVIEGKDLDFRGFNERWQQFLGQIEAGGTAAFFFAGHGIQLDKRNYLLPADTPGGSVAPEMLRRLSISFDQLREEVQSRRPGLSLFILDACRNNPFKDSPVRSLSSTRGLARVEVRPGSATFVMYSAAEGQLALDHLPQDAGGEINSVYVRKLLPLLTTEGLTIQAIAQQVRREVHAVAAMVPHEQAPDYYDGIIGLMCWSGHCADRSVPLAK